MFIICITGDKYMSKYYVEIVGEVENNIVSGASKKGITPEKFIAEILNKYAISVHIMESKETASGYKECGDINLDWANL